MAKSEELSKALAAAPQITSIEKLIQSNILELQKALPSGMDAERMGRIALTSVRLNPELAKLPEESYRSFLGALFTLAQIGLEPVNGQAYLMPFNNSKTGKIAVQAIIGYKGLKELFYRHSMAVSLDMHLVKENDSFDYQYGTDAFIHHKESKGNRGETIGYYAVAKLKGGGELFRYMTKEDCLAHGKRHSRSFDSKYSPWQTDPDSMCLKTVIIQLAKLLPVSIEIQKAIGADETVRNHLHGIPALETPTEDIWEDAVVTQSEVKKSSVPEKDPETGEVIPPASNSQETLL